MILPLTWPVFEFQVTGSATLNFVAMMKAPIGLRNLAGDLWSLCCGARRLEFDFGAQTLEIAMDDGHGQLLAKQHLTALRVERGNRRAQFQLDAA